MLIKQVRNIYGRCGVAIDYLSSQQGQSQQWLCLLFRYLSNLDERIRGH